MKSRPSSSAFSGAVTKLDPKEAFRLAGYHEYRKAVDHFNKLLSLAEQSELDSMNAIVDQRPEFAFESTLSRSLETAPSALSEPLDAAEVVKQSFPWVIALAKVELAASLSAFVNVAEPFRQVLPTDYEREPFRELLLDGFRTHYWSIRTDPEIRAMQGFTSSHTLAQMRRVELTKSFGAACLTQLAADLTAVQIQEIQSWLQQLDQVKRQLNSALIAKL